MAAPGVGQTSDPCLPEGSTPIELSYGREAAVVACHLPAAARHRTRAADPAFVIAPVDRHRAVRLQQPWRIFPGHCTPGRPCRASRAASPAPRGRPRPPACPSTGDGSRSLARGPRSHSRYDLRRVAQANLASTPRRARAATLPLSWTSTPNPLACGCATRSRGGAAQALDQRRRCRRPDRRPARNADGCDADEQRAPSLQPIPQDPLLLRELFLADLPRALLQLRRGLDAGTTRPARSPWPRWQTHQHDDAEHHQHPPHQAVDHAQAPVPTPTVECTVHHRSSWRSLRRWRPAPQQQRGQAQEQHRVESTDPAP